MTLTLERPSVSVSPGGDGGMPARRAVVRWAWRLFRREWRQQLLILALVIFAVAATVVGATVAINTPPPADAGFGTAKDSVTLQGSEARILSDVAQLKSHVGMIDVIANETVAIPGFVQTYELRSQDPRGPFGQPMLSLISGRYPTTAAAVAVTPSVASNFDLTVGRSWSVGGVERRVVGIVQNPQSLLDEFALVVPGQVTAPTQVTVLFDANGSELKGLHSTLRSIGASISTPASEAQQNLLNPETIVLALVTIGMLLIALVGVGGFTVLAQRRMRSIGMLASLGATDKNIRLVVRANGAVVGFVGAVTGVVLGVVAWLAYRPHAESSSHHLISAFALPWLVIAVSVLLAMLATFFAASRPARSITRVPIVTALSGRPAPPKPVRRSAVPGIIAGVIAFFVLGASGASAGSGGGSSGMGELVIGLVVLIVAVVLLAPFFLVALARVGRRAPISIRLAVRDLARYRARSGSALSAISLGVLIAVIICIVAAARYGDVLDYAGPNVASNQLIVYTPGNGPTGNGNGSSESPQALQAKVHEIAAALAGQELVLESPNAGMQYTGSGRQWNGPLFVATPQLLKAFGIKSSDFSPTAEVLSSRPGLSGVSGLQLTYTSGNGGGGSKSQTITVGPGSTPPGNGGGPDGGSGAQTCRLPGCLAHPTIDEVSALPAGTSAPNTALTEYAVHHFNIQSSLYGWLIQSKNPLTPTQINDAKQLAATAGMTIESKNDQPTSAEIINWATVFGIALALGILAMSVGLIRSETASDLRVLAASGAGSTTRRSLTAATAGALGLLGAVLGTVAGYVATIGFLRKNSLDGLNSLTHVPWMNLLLIMVGMPLAAAAIGWLLSGREPSTMTHQPIE